jgi:glycine oxidase
LHTSPGGNDNMKDTTDVAIIGGGIIGCAIAYYLRKAGREVTVFEQGEIGAQASSAAAGLLAPLGPLSGPGPFADLLLAGFAAFPALITELEEYTGIHLGYERNGALRIVRNPKRVAHLRKRLEAWQPLGLELHWLSGNEARQLEPSLTQEICAAVYVPAESQVRATHIVRAFAQAAQQAGAFMYTQTPVIGIQVQHQRVTGIYTAQGMRVNCQHLVIASGAWAARCGEWLHYSIPVLPLRGQMLLLQQATPPLRHIVFGDAAYLVPRETQVLVGATKEEAGFAVEITAEGQAWLRTTAERLVPTLQHSATQAAWAGLRPKTPNMRPLLGPVPDWDNVTLAVGHNSVGLMLSGISGQLIAEAITAGRLAPITAPFAPAPAAPEAR